MKQIETDFGWKRNLEYILATLKFQTKLILEYKGNLHTAFLIQFFFILTQFLFYLILYSNFQNEITWSLKDFIMFIAFSNLFHVIQGYIFWKTDLFGAITKGDLNMYLTKPINPFLFFYFFTQNGIVLFFQVSNLIFLIFSLIYFKVNIFILSVLFILILLMIETFLLSLFIDSINFIKLGLGRVIYPFQEKFMGLTRNFPGTFFNSLKFNFFLFLFQGYFISIVLIPILNGVSIFDFIFQISILISLIIIFGLGTWFNWYYGLKKYEAFG